MDNKQSAKLREQIETEMKMQNQWLQEMDLSDAKPLPASVTYRSSSITQIPYNPAAVLPTEGFKPVISKGNMDRAKHTYGMVYGSMDETKSRKDPRPIAQVYRNTGVPEKWPYPTVPESLRQSEYYGRGGKCKEDFYRGSGAFGATLE
jgi:hypothetical protein